MGKLIKNHWARLIILTAAACMYSRRNFNLRHIQAISTNTPQTN